MILINGQAEDRISILDRGLQYGDGIFETIAFRHGQLEWLNAHIERLAAGCKKLNIFYNQDIKESLLSDLEAVTSQLNTDSVIKIILTRGISGRGYRYSHDSTPTRIISTHPLPNYPETNQTGITVRLCQHRLVTQPALAEIKHLNRLDQILARNEWQDDAIAEGLMFDQNGLLIEGTMSNVFIVHSGQLITPSVKAVGVAGIMRAQIIAEANKQHIPLSVTDITLDTLLSASEVFVCNSLMGIWPVTRLVDTETTWPHGKLTKQLQQIFS